MRFMVYAGAVAVCASFCAAGICGVAIPEAFSYGMVVEVDADTGILMVEEYDWENERVDMITYRLAEDATYENAVSPEEIAEGDEVSIEYVQDDEGSRKAVYISVFKAGERGLPEPGGFDECPPVE